MAKFGYNNVKNVSIGHTSFELKYEYHFWVSYKEDIKPRSKFKSEDELLAELQELMAIYRKNLYHAQEFQK